MNISLPHDLRVKMAQVPLVSWSAVAVDAFRAKLFELAQDNGALRADDVRHQLNMAVSTAVVFINRHGKYYGDNCGGGANRNKEVVDLASKAVSVLETIVDKCEE